MTDDQIAARLTVLGADVAKQLRLAQTLGELRSLTSTIHVTFYTRVRTGGIDVVWQYLFAVGRSA